MAFNIDKYNKLKKELEQKANLLNRLEQEMKAEKRKEDTNFEGAHYVECYIIKNNVCVARDRIDVPISEH